MALLPQIDNAMSNTVNTMEVQLPSKTYKLIITDNNDSLYAADASNIVMFRFENGNLVGYTQSENRTVDFAIEDGDLTIESDNELTLQKFTLEDYYLMLESEYYGDRIIGYTDNLEAIKQAIYHILSIERYAYTIYDNNYGVELDQYVGKDIEYIRSTIQETLREALTYDLRINNVEVNDISVVDSDRVLINFTAYTIYGDLVLEVNVNV